MSNSKNGIGLKKQLIQIAFVLAITAVVFTVILSNNSDFSFSEFFNYLSGLNVFYVLGAFVCMALFIVLEGISLNEILSGLGYKRKFHQALIYSSSDIYYSAITPSATGGQPASVYYMSKDEIPVSVASASVTYNILMYTSSIMFIALFAFICKPSFFFEFDFIYRVLIIAGIIIQFVIVCFFLMLMAKPKLLRSMANGIVKFLAKIRVVKDVERQLLRVEAVIDSYKESVDLIGNNRILALKTFLLNLFQRVFQMSIAVCIYFAAGLKGVNILELYVLQSFCLIGSNSVPIPGAAGVSEGIYLSAFSSFMNKGMLINCMMATRGITYYICFILSGVMTFIYHIFITLRGKKGKI